MLLGEATEWWSSDYFVNNKANSLPIFTSFFPGGKQVKSSVGLSENFFFFFLVYDSCFKMGFLLLRRKISMSCGTLVAMTTIPFLVFKWQFELALKPEQHPGLLKSNCCLTRAQHLIPLPSFHLPSPGFYLKFIPQILLLNPLSQLWNAIKCINKEILVKCEERVSFPIYLLGRTKNRKTYFS